VQTLAYANNNCSVAAAAAAAAVERLIVNDYTHAVELMPLQNGTDLVTAALYGPRVTPSPR